MILLPQTFREINFTPLKKEIYIWIFLLLCFLGGTFFISKNNDFWKIIIEHHSPIFTSITTFLTQTVFWGTLSLLSIFSIWHLSHYKTKKSKVLPMIFSAITTAILIFILKAYFDYERPFQALDMIPTIELGEKSGESFPSGHAAVSWSLFMPFYRKNKLLGLLWGIIAFCISISRVYQLVHFPIDIVVGGFIGGIIGSFFSHKSSVYALHILWQNLEFRRQSFHFLAGFIAVFTHWIGLLRWRFILLLLFLGLLASWYSQRKKIPLISALLELFDRPEDKQFPGKGAFFYLLAVLLSIVLFPPHIAYSSILILAVGDSMNHLIASTFKHQKKIPWNHRKTIFGVLLGIFCGTFASQFFVGFLPALIASTITLLFESTRWNIKGWYIDDNITVPLIAGGVLLALGS